MGFGTVRTRFALLYAGAFAVSGLLVLAVASFSAKATVHVGSAGPPVVTHPFAQALGQVTSVMVSLAVLAVLSVAFGWLLAGRLLRPVRVITATARDISASNLSRRLRLGRRDDEFARLGETLNDLFGRLEASFDSQRHFVANASHELRTPLTAERTLLQVALADPMPTPGRCGTPARRCWPSVSRPNGSSRRCSRWRAASRELSGRNPLILPT